MQGLQLSPASLQWLLEQLEQVLTSACHMFCDFPFCTSALHGNVLLRAQLAPPGVLQPRPWTEALWRHEQHAPIAAAFLGSAEVHTPACQHESLVSPVTPI